jgi:hypothetical protein
MRPQEIQVENLRKARSSCLYFNLFPLLRVELTREARALSLSGRERGIGVNGREGGGDKRQYVAMKNENRIRKYNDLL